MQEDVGVFLFLLREGCKGFVELIEHGGGFFAALQDLDKLFESGIHVIGIDYTGIDFSQIGIDFVWHITDRRASCPGKKLLVPKGEDQIGGLVQMQPCHRPGKALDFCRFQI